MRDLAKQQEKDQALLKADHDREHKRRAARQQQQQQEQVLKTLKLEAEEARERSLQEERLRRRHQLSQSPHRAQSSPSGPTPGLQASNLHGGPSPSASPQQGSRSADVVSAPLDGAGSSGEVVVAVSQIASPTATQSASPQSVSPQSALRASAQSASPTATQSASPQSVSPQSASPMATQSASPMATQSTSPTATQSASPAATQRALPSPPQQSLIEEQTRYHSYLPVFGIVLLL